MFNSKNILLLMFICLISPAHADTKTSATDMTTISDLAYGTAGQGNLLNLYLPQQTGKARLPLIIWHSGSGWLRNDAKDFTNALNIAERFTAWGYAVATISIRSSSDARFPAQGYDVRAAIRWLRTHADQYQIDPNRFAFMGNSSGGWATSFAATTSDIKKLAGETGVDGVSSAVQVAVSFFGPTDLLSMDAFANAHNLPQSAEAYPHNSVTSPESMLIHCPGETEPGTQGIQDCPEATEKANPINYVKGREIPIWVLHGGQDPLVPYNQSEKLYQAYAAAENLALYTFIPDAVHDETNVIGSTDVTTKVHVPFAGEFQMHQKTLTWKDIEHFIHVNLARVPAVHR